MPANPGLALSVTAPLSESSRPCPTPLTRRLSALSNGPFLLVPHTRLSPLLACLPPGCPGLSWGGRPGPPLLRRALQPPGCAVPSGLYAGGRDPVHASSPIGRVPRALGDFNGQRARGLRCLQAEGALGGGGGGRRPRPLPCPRPLALTTPLSPCPQHRQLLKDSFMVELVEGARKLRHVFLFTDLLLCTKLKKQSGG